MLELAVLGLLKERAMHGYELRKQLTVRLGFFWTVSFGSLYPTLRKLERRGLVEKVRPSETGARRRQIYRITQSGEQQFLDLLEEGTGTPEEDKFPLRLAFFRYLRPETRIRLLERRKAYLEDRLAEGRRRLSRVAGGSDTYTLSLMRHGVDITERDIAWLDELIAAERGLWDPAQPQRGRRDAAGHTGNEPSPTAHEPRAGHTGNEPTGAAGRPDTGPDTSTPEVGEHADTPPGHASSATGRPEDAAEAIRQPEHPTDATRQPERAARGASQRAPQASETPEITTNA